MTRRKQQRKQQQQGLRKKSKAPLPTFLGWGILFVFLALLCMSNPAALAKEIEATREWQLVGENDTLPAGLHIRMDLTTGEKWAKLPDEDDSEENDNKVDSIVDAVAIDADGSVGASNDEANDNSGIPDYDYDMMHRTLSQLPPEEQARVGGIPELPHQGSLASLTEHERELVEMRLRQIWEQRQEELRNIEEEQVADLPQILKDRIQSLRDYLKDPGRHFEEVLLSKQQTAAESAGKTTEEESLSNIVDILADLEYLLTDLDMTRDFHTLGGWPLLSSLLSDEVHGDVSSLDTNQQAFVQKVQSTAAWALGTAVKNTGEFALWTVEPLVVGNQNKTTTLDLVQALLEASLATTTATTMSTATTSNMPESHNLQQKLVYALGSFLRGNLHAQVHFADKNGPDFLAQALGLLMQDCNGAGTCMPAPHYTKLTQRLLSLAADVVLESRQQQEQMQQHLMEDNNGIDTNTKAAVDLVVQSFVNNESWCNLVLDVWKNKPTAPALASAAVQALPVFEPQCRWESAHLIAVLEPVWTHYSSLDNEEELATLNHILDNNAAEQQ